MSQRIVLAYSGGLDTSVAIAWLRENLGADVIAVCIDVGQQDDLARAAERAKAIGAAAVEVIDAKPEFVQDYVHPAIQANALYEGVYPLSTALARPVMVKHLVQAAHAHDADAVAHGCTGKGNDQVRFEVGIGSLDPRLEILAPVRSWGMTREQEIEYAAARGLPITASKAKPYSIDENLWGRSIEGGALEDPSREPTEDAFLWTANAILAPASPETLEIAFEEGEPVEAGGETDPLRMVQRVNRVAGRHGIGRIDHVESRVVGIKSREIYECPAATVFLAAHRALEALVLPKDLLRQKANIEHAFADVVYEGLWFSPLREALQAFVEASQARVTGRVVLRLYKGSLAIVGRESPHALYDHALATYGAGDAFDASAAVGFVKIFGLPSKLYTRAGRKAPRTEVGSHVVPAR